MRNSKLYITTINFTTESEVKDLRAYISHVVGGPVKLRGRHSNRKIALGSKWSAGHTQNDVPWRKAERIDVYKVN